MSGAGPARLQTSTMRRWSRRSLTAGADRVQIDGADYVVEVSEAWGSHTEAVLLREP